MSLLEHKLKAMSNTDFCLTDIQTFIKPEVYLNVLLSDGTLLLWWTTNRKLSVDGFAPLFKYYNIDYHAYISKHNLEVVFRKIVINDNFERTNMLMHYAMYYFGNKYDGGQNELWKAYRDNLFCGYCYGDGFKIGDKVAIISNTENRTWWGSRLGKIGTVMGEISKDFEIWFDDGDKGRIFCNDLLLIRRKENQHDKNLSGWFL